MFRCQAFLIALFGALALLLTPAARADVPYIGNSTVPAFIRVVGSTAGVPDTVAGKFVVTIRDMAGNTMGGVFVGVDFSGCPDIRLAADPMNPNYSTGYCWNHTVGAYTNNYGVVGLTLVGSSWNAGTHAGLSCAMLFASGVLLSSPTVAAFDLDGMGGVTTSDLSVWMDDLGSHVYRGRSDYDANAIVNTSDLSVWMAALGSHRSSTTSATCP